MESIIEISVVMPVYNGEKYLKESIESILEQTYKNFEFIIIDDGSTDSSLDMIRSYSNTDNRIIIISRENRGLVHSLNEGIKLAKGKYIARMDADDISYKDRLEKQLGYFKSNPKVDILGTFAKIIGNEEKGKMIEEWFNQTWDDYAASERIRENCMILHPTAMIKRDVLLALGGYRDKYHIMEDDDLWIRAFNEGYNIYNYGEILLKYRVHKESKSSVESEDRGIRLKQKINLKLESFFEPDILNKKNLYIWGCGEGGKVAYDTLKENKIIIKGFIDSYKIGTFLENSIYKKEKLDSINSYVFIATSNGLPYAKEYLKDNNINYLYIM